MDAWPKIAVLAGGIGAARFLRGLVAATGSQPGDDHICVIGNTGDDIHLHGLRVCPDLDSVMYALGGGADPERGWGRAGESFRVLDELREYGAKPDWFSLGDLDFATHILRTQMLAAGYPSSLVTEALCRRWKLPVRLLPMTDDRVETHVVIDDPDAGGAKAIHFQEWWVGLGAAVPAREFVFVGHESATPGPGVLDALATADVIVLAPSNPVVSVGPILAVPGVRQAMRDARAPIVGVSPIIGQAPVRGMADKCLSTIGVPVSAVGVASHFGARSGGGLIDGWVIDTQDDDQRAAIEALGIECVATQTLMSSDAVAAELAATVLRLGAGIVDADAFGAGARP